MKKYLYLVCGSLLALAGCTRDADVEPARPVESGKVVLTGLSGEVTRTGFGEASEGVVPFRWSAGDCIWVGDVKSEPLESSGEKGAFVFESVAEADSYDVIYNMTGSAARRRSPPNRHRRRPVVPIWGATAISAMRRPMPTVRSC